MNNVSLLLTRRFRSGPENSKRGRPDTGKGKTTPGRRNSLSKLSRVPPQMTQMQKFEHNLKQLLRRHDLIDVFNFSKSSITSEDEEPANGTSQVHYSKPLNLLSLILNIADCKFKDEKDQSSVGVESYVDYQQIEGILLSERFRDDILNIIKEHHNLFNQTDTGQEPNKLAEEILSKAEAQAMENDLERNTIKHIYTQIKNQKSKSKSEPLFILGTGGQLLLVDRNGNPLQD